MNFKRGIIALITGSISVFCIGYLLQPLQIPSNYDIALVFFISGIFVGFIARKKGWLYGGVMPFLIYILVFISILIWFSWTFTYQEKVPVQSFLEAFYKLSGESNFQPYLIIILKIILSAMFFGSIGGFIGQKVYELSPKYSSK